MYSLAVIGNHWHR